MAKFDTETAASGAVSGATIGSTFGPWGAAIGGLAGGALGLFGKKKKKKPKPISTLDPQQQKLYNDYIAGIRGEGPFSNLYNFDTEGYNKVFDQTIGRQANRNFQENTIPGITGQFRGSNLMNSSYTGEALSRAGRDVQENLDALRSQNVFQGQQEAQRARRAGITDVLGTHSVPQEKKGILDQILGQVGPAAGEYLGGYLSDTWNNYKNRNANPVA
jgi:hypothetical protein